MLYNHLQKNSDKIIDEKFITFFLNSRENKDKTNLNFFRVPIKRFNQLYRQYMKRLFLFNGFWSKKDIFFPKRNNINEEHNEIKYKQINYYTKNFQLPFFSPILEYKNYYPNFSKYNGELYKKNQKKILDYDFKLDYEESAKKIIEILIPNNYYLKKNYIIEKCCLVKNLHHVFGDLMLIHRNNKKNFDIIFQSLIEYKNKDKNFTCNKNNNKTDSRKKSSASNDNKKNSNNFNYNSLCYGAIFPFPERESKRRISINSNDILFILIRVYYKRVSAIEIFTINKSYYFNFRNQFDINDLKTNNILNEIKNYPFLKEIKVKKDKIILGYYNIKYKPYLFPLFEDEITLWNKKVNFFNNYDILILINLFSNRSFRDVFQYPIFPTLYDLLNLKRHMDEHIGFQTIIPESIKRKDLYLKYFITDENNLINDEELYLLNVHYSNPSFVFNFLFRIFPYSFLHIEFQGDGFDNPNRLFTIIQISLKNTLQDKADVRELIPELFYMIDLFYNKNNILFEKLHDGKEIDWTYVTEKERENPIQSDIKKIENYANFLFKMRKNLEEEKYINKWIDLIFGINQKYFVLSDKEKFQYYESDSYTIFKNNVNILEDKIKMDMFNFGVLPYQLFNQPFPLKIEKKDSTLKNLNILNKELFEDEHIKIYSPIQTFICKGRILIDDNYIKIIDQNYKINKLENYYNFLNNIPQKDNFIEINKYIFDNSFGSLNLNLQKNIKNKSFVNYYFVGDIYGNVLVYEIKEPNNNANEYIHEYKEEKIKLKTTLSFEMVTEDDLIGLINSQKVLNNIVENDSEYKFLNYNIEIRLVNKLHDHMNEIKFIDFNSRLNILLSYSLDNFINIYIFPKLKLINVIDTNSFKDKNDINYFDEVVLLSYPFPLIVCHNKQYIYILSINGDLIKYDKLNEGEIIEFFIDKNLGLIEDKVQIIDSHKKIKSVFNEF